MTDQHGELALGGNKRELEGPKGPECRARGRQVTAGRDRFLLMGGKAPAAPGGDDPAEG